MTPKKTDRVRRNRAAVAELRKRPHVRLCRCCRATLDWIESHADTPWAEVALAQARELVDDGERGRQVAG